MSFASPFPRLLINERGDHRGRTRRKGKERRTRLTDHLRCEPTFSVIIPTYNRAHTIFQVLESVGAQTFPDFECLVVDDGSTDGDALKLTVSSLNDERFKYIRKPNGGASSARNVGFDSARGRYIALLDSDDMFLPHKLETFVGVLDAHSGDILVFSRLIANRDIGRVWVKPPRGPKRGERIDEYLMCTPGWIQTSTMVLPRSLAQRVRFDETLPSSQDTDFAIRASNAGAEIIFIDEPLTVYDDKQIQGRVSKGKNYTDQLAWIERMRGRHVSERAYWGYRGWQCARLASYTSRSYGFRLFTSSALRGVYPFRQALVIVAQVLIPPTFYQSIASRVVILFGRNPLVGKRDGS